MHSKSHANQPESIDLTPLALDVVAGPPLAPVQIAPGEAAVIGRSSQSQVVLPDEAVSRKHASITRRNETWFVSDLGSRHGTFVNAVQLEPNGLVPLKAGDLVGIGPWTFRVRVGAGMMTPGHVTTVDTVGRQRVERVSDRELAAITQQRLNLLMNCAAAVAGATDDQSLAQVVLSAAIEGTGFPRAALLREVGSGEEVRVIADINPAGATIDAAAGGGSGGGGAPAGGGFSRSLIAAARTGEMARLTADAPLQAAESIMRLGIQTALCAPILIGNSVGAYLYMDARTGEPGSGAFPPSRPGSRGVQHDAAAFCQAIARMCSMALGNMARQDLEKRQRELVQDLTAAREAQRLIMPPEEATVGGLRYAMRMRSGRYVAGDLFDVVDLGSGRVAVFLGDVAGKGISAAILMATAQTYLNAALRTNPDGAAAVREVNRYICTHSSSNKFISLWLGIYDANTRVLSIVDAGHGHWVFVSPGQAVRRVSTAGGLPLGIDPDATYLSEQIELAAGSRVVVFSDGVVEQPGTEGAMFGLERAISAIGPCSSAAECVKAMFAAVFAFAQTESLADDTTVASIEVA